MSSRACALHLFCGATGGGGGDLRASPAASGRPWVRGLGCSNQARTSASFYKTLQKPSLLLYGGEACPDSVMRSIPGLVLVFGGGCRTLVIGGGWWASRVAWAGS